MKLAIDFFLIFFFVSESSDQDGNDDDDFEPPKPKKSKIPEADDDCSKAELVNGLDGEIGSDEELDPYVRKILERTELYRRGEASKRMHKSVAMGSVQRPDSVTEIVEKSRKNVVEGM